MAAHRRDLHAAVGPLEQRIGRETHRITVELLGVDESRPGVRELVQATLDLVRGLGWPTRSPTTRPAASGSSTSGPPRSTTRGPGMSTAEPVLEDVLADLAAEGDRIDALVAGLDEAGWRHADPGRGLGRRPQIAHLAWTDETARRRGHRQGGLGRAGAEAIANPRGLRRRGGARRGGAGADMLARWRAARAGWPRCCATSPRAEAALVRPADEPDLDGHRAVHGDLGARARRADALGSRSEPTDRVRHVAHLGVRTRGLRLRRPWPRAAPEEFHVELGRRPASLWTGGRTMRRSGDRVGVRLLPAGHPARAPRRPRPGRHGPGRRPVARHRPGVRRPAGTGRGRRARHDHRDPASRQLQRVLRRPALRDAGDARGR